MTDPTSAETRLGRLLDRLLKAAEDSMHSGDLEQARATAEEVRAVDPDNRRAERILRLVASRQLAPAGERALMTLLFSDLVGSTMLSERVQPEELRDLFALYRAAAHEAVERYSGSVMHYAGDGILAGFGYPKPHEDDARRAVLAGLDLVTAMADARSDLERRFGSAVAVRVGTHTGRVVITDLRRNGSVRERDSIVGLAPNLAARIQSEAEPDTVVISDVTHQLVDTDFVMHSLGVRDLKGISRPVEVYVVQRPRYAGARFEAERYRKGGLVGRETQKQRLLDAWEKVRDEQGGGRAFLLVGEAGIGKTRLVAEVLDRVEAGGGTALGAGSLPYYSNVSLWPITRALERAIDGEGDEALVAYFERLELDPGRLVPFLAPLLGVDASEYPTPELEPSAFLDETLNRIVEWLSALGESKPHLVILEDLHWADPSTVTLAGRLAANCPSSVMMIATTRDPTTIPWLDDVEVVNLGRLDAEASRRLVENVAGGRELSEDLRQSIVERAAGVPLFVEELTRSCLDADRSDPIPLRLQELFTWRLKAPDVDLGIVQVAATVGPGFSASVVAEVVGDDGRVADQIQVLLDEGIVEPAVGPDSYRFRHALMRDAAYETQVLDLRIRTHARLAEVLTARGAEPAVIAEHFDRAGDPAQAASLYLVAGQSEQARGAHTEAARLFTRAIELLEQVPEAEERDLQELMARMMRGLSVSSTQGYAAPEVQADHRRAEVLASRLDARLEVLPSLIAIWAYWLTSGDLSTARGLVERLENLVSRPEFAWFEPEVDSCAGWLDLYRGELGSAREHLERAVTGFNARPFDQIVSPFWPLPNDPVAVSEIALACVSAIQGDLEEADRWQVGAIRRSEEVGFPRGPFSLAFVKTYAAWIQRFLGDHDKARLLGAEVVGIGQSYGYAYWMLLGSSYVAAGRPGGAPERGFLEETIANIRLLGQEAFVASNLSYLAILSHEDGLVEEALSLVEEALDVVAKTGECLHLPELLRHRARYSLELGGAPTEIVADLREALDESRRQGAKVAHLRAALAIARLPEEHRPKEWREWLASARDAVTGAIGEVREADEVLAGER